MLVILDPGHGGWDPGGGTNELWKEKDLNLKISQYQNRRFRDLGIPSRLSREGDETLTPQERVARINSMLTDNTILISNHINVSGSKGAEVIYSIDNSPLLAQMIAEEIRKTGQTIRNVYTRTNAMGQDYYFILRDTFADESVLIEYGFADNIDDKQRLYYNWQALAEAVVRAVTNYLEFPYSMPFYTIHVVRPGESLYTIARDYNITFDKLIRDNDLTSDELAVGQELFIYL